MPFDFQMKDKDGNLIYDSNVYVHKSKDKYPNYEFNDDESIKTVYEYYENNSLKSEREYHDIGDRMILNGNFKTYYKNGQIGEEGNW